jgi:uncharacterized protein YukE
MTRIRIDAEGIAELGATLEDLADSLAHARDGRADRWALGPGDSAAAFDDLVTHWRVQRLALARSLADLGAAARTAGPVYVSAEQAIGGRFLVGGLW